MEYNATATTNNRPAMFNLERAGQSATVRVLHSSVSTIEAATTHWVQDPTTGKKRSFKCVSDGCPMCDRGIGALTKVYIHLWDYTDNQEKVWVRTDKIIPQLLTVQNSWGNLSDCVVTITRNTDQFPTYNVMPVNAASYPPVPGELVDKRVSFMYYMTRSKDELNTYFTTGVLPAHTTTPFIPREQYIQQMKGSSNPQQMQPGITTPVQQSAAQSTATPVFQQSQSVTSNPFASIGSKTTPNPFETAASQTTSNPFEIKRV